MKPFIIGIAGGTGSGKTTLAKKIGEHFGEEHVLCLAHDSYYRDRPDLSSEERKRINYDHPNSLETELLVEHLKMLEESREIEVPRYDFAGDARMLETTKCSPRPVIVVEGILVLEAKVLREKFDLCIFVETEADIRFIRRLERDVKERGRTVESVIGRYLETVRPMHEEFVEPSKKFADVIIPEGGENVRALEVVLTLVAEQVKKRQGG